MTISPKRPLELSDRDHEALHEALNKTKDKPGAHVRVPREALGALLRDYGRLLAVLRE